MGIAYLDTFSGIAGDMTLAALVDAGADENLIQKKISSLGLKQVQLNFSDVMQHCFRCKRLDVEHPPEHAHRHLSDIQSMLNGGELSESERDIALRVFKRIAVAEAKVHGVSVESVHFHEVGAIDSIVDIVGVAVALVQLEIDRIVASPTPTGCGQITIAHGLVSVPAPATAELLRGVPIKSSAIEAELTTPTGAAFLACLVDEFGPLPSMQVKRIGYGAGHKQLKEQANLLRVLIGEAEQPVGDEVLLLETNLDDCTGEQIGFAVEQLWKRAALDVYTTPISMKKSRPAVILSVLGRVESRQALEDCIFEHTGSLGIRRSRLRRSTLRREIRRVHTALGVARVKLAWGTGQQGGMAGARIAPEFEDCRSLANEHSLPVSHVFEVVRGAAAEQVLAHGLSNSVIHADDHSHGHDHGHDHGPGGHSH